MAPVPSVGGPPPFHCLHFIPLFTLGHRGELEHWTEAGLDLYQFHYYDWMEHHYPLDFPAADLGLDRPVMVGEICPTDVAARLDLLRGNGYAGVLFRSLNADYDFRVVAEEYRDWVRGQSHEYRDMHRLNGFRQG